MIPLFFGFALLSVMWFVTLLLHWRRPRGAGESVSLLVAEAIALGTSRRAVIGTSAGIMAFAGAWTVDASYPFCIFVALIACVPLATLRAARAMQRELAKDDAHALLVGTVLIARSPNGEASLGVSSTVICRARDYAVPRSIAR